MKSSVQYRINNNNDNINKDDNNKIDVQFEVIRTIFIFNKLKVKNKNFSLLIISSLPPDHLSRTFKIS
jgi:hypothetical protein